MTFNDYATRYRPGLDLVLSGVSIDIRGGEKVACLICVLSFLWTIQFLDTVRSASSEGRFRFNSVGLWSAICGGDGDHGCNHVVHHNPRIQAK